MADITFTESEIKDLIFALARGKGEDATDSESESEKPADEGKPKDAAEDKAEGETPATEEEGIGAPHGKKSTAEMMAEKMKAKEKKAS